MLPIEIPHDMPDWMARAFAKFNEHVHQYRLKMASIETEFQALTAIHFAIIEQIRQKGMKLNKHFSTKNENRNIQLLEQDLKAMTDKLEDICMKTPNRIMTNSRFSTFLTEKREKKLIPARQSTKISDTENNSKNYKYPPKLSTNPFKTPPTKISTQRKNQNSYTKSSATPPTSKKTHTATITTCPVQNTTYSTSQSTPPTRTVPKSTTSTASSTHSTSQSTPPTRTVPKSTTATASSTHSTLTTTGTTTTISSHSSPSPHPTKQSTSFSAFKPTKVTPYQPVVKLVSHMPKYLLDKKLHQKSVIELLDITNQQINKQPTENATLPKNTIMTEENNDAIEIDNSEKEDTQNTQFNNTFEATHQQSKTKKDKTKLSKKLQNQALNTKTTTPKKSNEEKTKSPTLKRKSNVESNSTSKKSKSTPVPAQQNTNNKCNNKQNNSPKKKKKYATYMTLNASQKCELTKITKEKKQTYYKYIRLKGEPKQIANLLRTKTKNENGNFECNQCSYESRTNWDINRHVEQEHLEHQDMHAPTHPVHIETPIVLQ